MKLFYKKDYENLLVMYTSLEIEYKKKTEAALKEIREKCSAEIQAMKDRNDYKIQEISYNYKKIVEELNAEIKALKGSKGGFTKEINKLKSQCEKLELENAELEKKLKESMTDKYLVRKVKSTKPVKQEMRAKKVCQTGQIRKALQEIAELHS